MDDYYLSILGNSVRVIPPTVEAIEAIAFAAVLLFASAFVSASEVAFFSLKPSDLNRMEEEGHERDSSLTRLLGRSQHLLATILILNNLFNVSIIILCNYFFIQVFDFTQTPVIGFVIQTILLTFLLLLFGEVMPKLYASQHALRFSRFSAPVISFFERLFRPFTNLLVHSTGAINRVMMYKNENISLDQLSQALELTSDKLEEEKMMLEGIIRFGDKTAREIMTSRLDMTTLSQKLTFRQVMDAIVECGYSRIPVFDVTQDNIKGILYVKDLLPHINKPDTFRWQSLIRAAFFVPESKKVDGLLEDFQKNKIHMAIVVDEYGGTSGLVTLEDILEEIVGDINDEYDEEEIAYVKQNDGSYLFDAKTSIEEFCKIVEIDLDTFDLVSGEADTLAGMILEIKGEFPSVGESVHFHEHEFVVVELDQRRIKKLKYHRLEQEIIFD